MPAPPPQPSRARTVVIVVIALLVIAGLVAPAAFAHAQLLRSDPQNGATLPMTDQVVLTFNEDINPDFVQIVVTGPDGPLSLDDVVVEGALVTQPVTPASSGAHTLSYRVVSADGHPVSGQIDFTLTDVAAPNTTGTTTSEPPTTPEQPTRVSAEEMATDVPAEERGTAISPFLMLGGAVVLAGLVGAGGWVARQRRHPEH